MVDCGPFLLVVLGIATIGWLVAPSVVAGYRRRQYERYEDYSYSQIAVDFPIPDTGLSLTVRRRNALKELTSEIHQQAVTAQNVYHAAVVRSATSLFLASSALALTAAQIENLASVVPLDRIFSADCRHWLHIELATIDTISIMLLIILYYSALTSNRRWINTRILSELQRQYEFLTLVFPNATFNSGPRDLTSQFYAEAEKTRNMLHVNSLTEITSRIRHFWKARKLAVANNILEAPNMTGDAVLLYLDKRFRRQLGWFMDSMHRLEVSAEKRKQRLIRLYWMVFAFAAAKLLMILLAEHEHAGNPVTIQSYIGLWRLISTMLLPTLLIMTGWSAVETAYYLNQNVRSLFHRYKSQADRIRRSLTALYASLCVDDLLTQPIDYDKKIQIGHHILEFEEMMMEELVDWVHISSHDVIEIAP